MNHPKGIGSNGSFKLASKEAKREKKKKSAEIDENEEGEYNFVHILCQIDKSCVFRRRS